MTTNADQTRTLRVHRFKRGDEAPHMEEHDVPFDERTTVLEALRWIHLHRDPTLGIRHSCFHASCGTCGVRVNGRERLACVTKLSDFAGTITVDPIANLPVLHDVIVDMTPFMARYPDPHPIVRESEYLPESATVEGITEHERYEDCIECGLCLSACPVAATDDSYIGPAALAYAQRLLEESRGADRAAILDWADQDAGAWRCHAAFECTEACPSDVRPAQRIMALRKELRHRRREQGRAVPEAPTSSSGGPA
jgi:succinate dehydrogenase / fumarate reductase iron-sulfur subunit